MKRAVADVNGFKLFYDAEKVSENEARETADDLIKRAFAFYNGKRPQIFVPVYKQVPVTREVTYILTTKGWLNDKQRADYIRRGDVGEDYEICEPYQSKTVEEFDHYDYVEDKYNGHFEDVSIAGMVDNYWTLNWNTYLEDDRFENTILSIIQKKSRYGDDYHEKPLDYLTPYEFDLLSRESSDASPKVSSEPACPVDDDWF